MIRLKGPKYLSTLQLILFYILFCLLMPLTAVARPTRQDQVEPPILKEGLVRTLRAGPKGITVTGLIQRIEKRGVAFQLTPADEQDIRAAGKYLGPKGLDELVKAVRVNFRPPSDSPFRITYLLLEGNSIDLFFRRKIRQQWDADVGGNPIIVSNPTLKKLSYLVNNFSESFPDLEAYDVQKGEQVYGDEGQARMDARKRRRLFVGGTDSEGRTLTLAIGALPKLINSLNVPEQSWRALWRDERLSDGPDLDPANIIFRKFAASRRDLELVEDSTLRDLYLHITEKGMPHDFGYFEVELRYAYMDFCDAHAGSQSQVHSYTESSFYGPSLSLRVAVIENTSKDVVRLGNFILKENNSEQLRGRDQDQAYLAQQHSQRQDLFPLKILKPGEKIVIPMEMIVGRASTEDRPEVVSTVPNQAVNRLKKNGEMVFPILGDEGEVINSVSVKAEAIENIVKRPGMNFTSTKDYVYGPSIKIEAVEIDRRDYLVRLFDPTKLLITAAGEGVGSCPYIYTYLPENGGLLNEGVILYGINEKSKESTDEKVLRSFDGRILIRERDPEESFIDSMFIKAVAPDGRESILYPQNEKLRFSEGDYLRLKQGEHLIVNFDLPKNFIAHKYVLVTKGYYVPYKTAPSRSNIRPGSKLK